MRKQVLYRSGGCLIALALISTGWWWSFEAGMFGVPFIAQRSRAALGDGWYRVQTTGLLGHPTKTTDLVWNHGVVVRAISRYINDVLYVGDGCVVYQKPGPTQYTFWKSCEGRQPTRLMALERPARIESEGIEILGEDDSGIVVVRTLSKSEIQAAARTGGEILSN